MTITKLLTELQPDDPIVQDANFQIDAEYVQSTDNKIIVIQRYLSEGLINGTVVTRVLTAEALTKGDVVTYVDNPQNELQIGKATAASLVTGGAPLGMIIEDVAIGTLAKVAIYGVIPKEISGITPGPEKIAIVSAIGRAEPAVAVVDTDYLLGSLSSLGALTLMPSIALSYFGSIGVVAADVADATPLAIASKLCRRGLSAEAAFGNLECIDLDATGDITTTGSVIAPGGLSTGSGSFEGDVSVNGGLLATGDIETGNSIIAVTATISGNANITGTVNANTVSATNFNSFDNYTFDKAGNALIRQSAQASNIATHPLNITPQPPFSSATLTNRKGGDLVVNFNAPSDVSAGQNIESSYIEKRGSDTLKTTKFINSNDASGYSVYSIQYGKVLSQSLSCFSDTSAASANGETTGAILLRTGANAGFTGVESGIIQIYSGDVTGAAANGCKSGGITLRSGEVTNGSGSGSLTIQSGQTSGSGNVSGSMSLFTGNSTTSNSGALLLYTGNVSTSGNSGSAGLSTGSTFSGTTGSINITCGNATSGTGGTVSIGAGNGTVVAGQINFLGGSGSGQGGSMTFSAGNGNAVGISIGGHLTFNAGNGGNLAGSAGGSIMLAPNKTNAKKGHLIVGSSLPIDCDSVGGTGPYFYLEKLASVPASLPALPGGGGGLRFATDGTILYIFTSGGTRKAVTAS
jgi:hypothetical protein